MAGRVAYYGGIVNNGLVLDLDAAKKDSYPTTGTIWSDISGNQNNGSLQNGTLFTTLGGGSFYFDGVSNSATAPSSLSLLTIVNSVSICFWVKLGSIKNAYAAFFTKSGFANNVGIRGSDGFTIWYSSLGNWVAGYSGVYNNGGWAYMCYTYDGASQTIYRNGSQILTRSITGNFTTSASNLVIADSTFNGWLGQSTIYNRALSSTEVLQNYNATKGRYGL
jgi:hypothetical protein